MASGEMTTPVIGYARPGWTGRPLKYSDGKLDYEFSQCPSCLGFHAASNLSCNGKREPSDHQCEAVLGEIRCHRPDNHLGDHEAKGSGLRVEWGPEWVDVTERVTDVQTRKGR